MYEHSLTAVILIAAVLAVPLSVADDRGVQTHVRVIPTGEPGTLGICKVNVPSV